MTDIEIAGKADIRPIREIAAKIGMDEDRLEPYGRYKAKLPLDIIDDRKISESHLILVTAISPTPAGEGKTTTSIGLNDGLNLIGKKSIVVLREPSLGPVFGMKGGAAGGGYSQVIPMEDINLHFNGDFAAIQAANNLLAAMIDNSIQSKSNNSGIDPRTVPWKRAIDMNDRSLRNIVSGLGGKNGGIVREAGFNIAAASEVMAILCLSSDLADLKSRLANIYIGDRYDGSPVFARDIKAHGAMAVLLKDAIKPNLVQSLEGNPAIIHGGPFANIAQGTNSIVATKAGLSLGDFVVTEAGFGADLGAEKFLDIKCRNAGFFPSCAVIVATIRALKYHGGMKRENLHEPDSGAVALGFPNLEKHIENIRAFGLPAVVAINRFSQDSNEEIDILQKMCRNLGISAIVANPWGEGGKGCMALAGEVAAISMGNERPASRFAYEIEDSIRTKIEKIAFGIYGANAVDFSEQAEKDLATISRLGMDDAEVCIAKNQYSFSDDPKKLGRPVNFGIHVKTIEICAGAGFVVPITGTVLRMPGLPDRPAAEGMDIDISGKISGLA